MGHTHQIANRSLVGIAGDVCQGKERSSWRAPVSACACPPKNSSHDTVEEVILPVSSHCDAAREEAGTFYRGASDCAGGKNHPRTETI